MQRGVVVNKGSKAFVKFSSCRKRLRKCYRIRTYDILIGKHLVIIKIVVDQKRCCAVLIDLVGAFQTDRQIRLVIDNEHYDVAGGNRIRSLIDLAHDVVYEITKITFGVQDLINFLVLQRDIFRHFLIGLS